MEELKYDFLRKATVTINSGQTRTLVLTGNIFDLFYIRKEDLPREQAKTNPLGKYAPLVNFLCSKWNQPRRSILIVYELNGPIRFLNPPDKDKMKDAWALWKTGMSFEEISIHGMFAHTRQQVEQHKKLSLIFDTTLEKAIGHPTAARGRVACEQAVDHCGAAVPVVEHPAATSEIAAS